MTVMEYCVPGFNFTETAPVPCVTSRQSVVTFWPPPTKVTWTVGWWLFGTANLSFVVVQGIDWSAEIISSYPLNQVLFKPILWVRIAALEARNLRSFLW